MSLDSLWSSRRVAFNLKRLANGFTNAITHAGCREELLAAIVAARPPTASIRMQCSPRSLERFLEVHGSCNSAECGGAGHGEFWAVADVLGARHVSADGIRTVPTHEPFGSFMQNKINRRLHVHHVACVNFGCTSGQTIACLPSS